MQIDCEKQEVSRYISSTTSIKRTPNGAGFERSEGFMFRILLENLIAIT